MAFNVIVIIFLETTFFIKPWLKRISEIEKEPYLKLGDQVNTS